MASLEYFIQYYHIDPQYWTISSQVADRSFFPKYPQLNFGLLLQSMTFIELLFQYYIWSIFLKIISTDSDAWWMKKPIYTKLCGPVSKKVDLI